MSFRHSRTAAATATAIGRRQRTRTFITSKLTIHLWLAFANYYVKIAFARCPASGHCQRVYAPLSPLLIRMRHARQHAMRQYAIRQVHGRSALVRPVTCANLFCGRLHANPFRRDLFAQCRRSVRAATKTTAAVGGRQQSVGSARARVRDEACTPFDSV